MRLSRPVQNLRHILAQNLKRLRKVRGLSLERLALKAGLSRNTPAALEHERYSATIDVLAKLGHALGVDAYELLRPTADDDVRGPAKSAGAKVKSAGRQRKRRGK